MKSVSVALLLVLCSAVGTRAAVIADADSSKDALKAGGHPAEKIITLLKGLKEKTISVMQEEEVAYGKFTYWCSTSSSELKDAIADEKEKIEELTDYIEGKKNDIATFEADIDKLEEQLGDLDKEAIAAKKKRKDTNDLYNDEHDNLSKTITGVKDCITALEGAEGKTESLVSAKRKLRKVISLLSISTRGPDVEAAGDLEAHVDKYDFKSENVIELLKNLLLKFEDDLTVVTKEETNSVNAYNLAKDARDNAITAAKKSKDKKDKFNEAAKKDKKQAEGDKKDTEEDLDADSKTLQETTDSCATKKSEFEERTSVQKGEIDALDMAVKIMAKVTGVRTEAPSNPVPPAAPVKFLQLSQEVHSLADPKQKALKLLKETADEFHSRAIERLAQEVETHLKDGPFDQVVNMIQKMIFRLMDEQKQED